MLFYGSIRENMYLFSVINTLIKINQDEDEDERPRSDNNNDAQMSLNRFDHRQRFNRFMINKNQVLARSSNKRSTSEVSPINAIKHESSRNTKIVSPLKQRAREHPYSYSILFKS